MAKNKNSKEKSNSEALVEMVKVIIKRYEKEIDFSPTLTIHIADYFDEDEGKYGKVISIYFETLSFRRKRKEKYDEEISLYT